MASVRFEHLTKKFGNVVAVSDFTLEVPDKDFLILVGPSGCGKSTLLRLLAGIEESTSGQIYINDRPVNDLAPKDRDIAMVFQSYALYPHMSVYDNMAFSLKLKGISKKEIERRVQATADKLGIRNLLLRKPKQLSGGQRQRVAVGRAIIREPQVFLMDEPLSNLDAKLRVQTRAEIIKLHHMLETTFIYVTHDQVEAMTMGKHIAVMHDGVLQQIGTPREVYDFPVNIFVAGFIGSPAMNFFDGTLAGSSREMYFRTADFTLRLPTNKAERLAEYVGKDVLLGIRPEHISDQCLLTDTAKSEGCSLSAEVDVVETPGSETFVYLLSGKQIFLAKLDARSEVTIGSQLDVVFDMEHIHTFERVTGLAIGTGNA